MPPWGVRKHPESEDQAPSEEQGRVRAFPKLTGPQNDQHFLYQSGFFFSYIAKVLPCGQSPESHERGPSFILMLRAVVLPLAMCGLSSAASAPGPCQHLYLSLGVSLCLSSSPFHWMHIGRVSLGLCPPGGRGASRTSSRSASERTGSQESLRREKEEGTTGGQMPSTSSPSTRNTQLALGPCPSRQWFPFIPSPAVLCRTQAYQTSSLP